jgi:rSAM/selenodomain-associated transferase 2
MISVIIPALNEERHINTCIEAITTEGCACEIIVVDGGSSDRTREKAGSIPGVKVLRSEKGRGLQMNAGAFMAEGEVLLFLHADTVLEKGWSLSLSVALGDSAVSGGAFTFAIDSPEIKYRLIEKWVKIRCFLFKLPYGDQAIFIRRDVFRSIGGYEEIPLMEDVNFIGRLKKVGKLVISTRRAFTSERRWLRRGLVYTALLNQCIMLLYRMGISPRRLERIYYR